MLSTEPEKRPSVADLMKNPKIKLRLNEREMRDEYSKLKQRELQINEKLDSLKNKEEDLKKKEEALKEREQKAQELRFQLSQSSGFYKSIDN